MTEPPEWIQKRLDEQREELKHQHDLYHANAENSAHEYENFVYSLTHEQAQYMMQFLSGLLNQSNVGKTAAMSATLADIVRTDAVRRNVCPACNKNHDDELDTVVNDPSYGPEVILSDSPLPGDDAQPETDQPITVPENFYTQGDDIAQYLELCHAYGVERVPGMRNKVRCVRPKPFNQKGQCGYEWPSLDDRMMRPADECPRCIQANKTG